MDWEGLALNSYTRTLSTFFFTGGAVISEVGVKKNAIIFFREKKTH